MNKVGHEAWEKHQAFPQRGWVRITRETLAAFMERPKEKRSGEKGIFPNMENSMTLSLTSAKAEQKT